MNWDKSFIFTMLNPYLRAIDKGSFFRTPFYFLYDVIGIANLLFPIYFVFLAIKENIFVFEMKYKIVGGLLLLIIVFAGWISFQLWLNRSKRISEISKTGDEFVAIPIFSHLLQTMGEWVGTWIAVVGSLTALLLSFSLKTDDGAYFLKTLNLSFMKSTFAYVFIMPLFGFSIILLTRFLAEQFKVFASIANNTRKDK
ncbi:MAG: hypothetical protein KGV44_15260 [Flavobacteriaceae bacterium]|nr:hypothetical protein [Flavobacteriaceae bacterium]